MKRKKFCLMVIAMIAAISIAALGSAGEGLMMLEGGKLGDTPFPHKENQDRIKDCNACHNLIPQEKGITQKLIKMNKIKKACPCFPFSYRC